MGKSSPRYHVERPETRLEFECRAGFPLLGADRSRVPSWLRNVPVRRRLTDAHSLDALVEIVVDLGRPVQLHFPGDHVLFPHVATAHRLSAIRNRYRDLVGVTMRVGRHLPGRRQG